MSDARQITSYQSLKSPSSGSEYINDSHRLLIDSDALTESEKQATLLTILDSLKDRECSKPDYDWSAISDKLLSIDISQHPRHLQDTENQLEILVKKYHNSAPDNQEALATIANNLFLLGGTSLVTSNRKLLHDVALLDKIITQRRMLNTQHYLQARNSLTIFKEKYKSSKWDQMFKYLIGFNAGMNTGSSFYSVMTALFLTVPIIVVSGVFSLVLCLTIAHYFYNSYKDEDNEMIEEVEKDEKMLKTAANTESLLRIKCYKLISQKMALLPQCLSADIKVINDKTKIATLIENFKSETAINQLDEFIDNKLKTYPREAAHNKRFNMPAPKQNSIYTRVFHSKYWGPILNFFGAAGTSFGVAKTILALVGVTALLGSPLALLGVLTGVTVVIGAAFAIKHLNFTLKSEEKKKYLKKFQTDQIQQLNNKAKQLRKFKNSMTTDLIYMNSKVTQNTAAPAVPALTTALIPIPSIVAEITSDAALMGNNGIFKNVAIDNASLPPAGRVLECKAC